MSSKPEFILVPGAWHSPSCFNKTTTLLTKAGYKTHCVTLPSVGGTHLTSFDPDVLAIRSTINSVLSTGTDVVLMMHSYGGVVGSEALAEYVNGIGTGKGGKEGWGKVRRLVYVCAFVLGEGMSLMKMVGDGPLPSWWLVDGKGGVDPDTPKEIFYNDISPEEAAPYISALRTQSFKSKSSEVTVAPWKVIHCTYILCKKDNAIPLPMQEGMLNGAKEAAPGAFDVVENVDAGHSPFISKPEWLAEKLIKAAQ